MVGERFSEAGTSVLGRAEYKDLVASMAGAFERWGNQWLKFGTPVRDTPWLRKPRSLHGDHKFLAPQLAMTNMFDKLGVSTRLELALFAVNHHLPLITIH